MLLIERIAAIAKADRHDTRYFSFEAGFAMAAAEVFAEMDYPHNVAAGLHWHPARGCIAGVAVHRFHPERLREQHSVDLPWVTAMITYNQDVACADWQSGLCAQRRQAHAPFMNGRGDPLNEARFDHKDQAG